MKKILVTNAGRSAGINFCRSLRLAPEKFKIIGIDQNKYSLMNAEADAKYLCPAADDPQYIGYLQTIIDSEGIDLLYPSKTNLELWKISEERDSLNTSILLPEDNLIRIFEDKFLTYELMRKAGVTVPETILVSDVSDLEMMFKKYPQGIWLRATTGCGGNGSVCAHDISYAKSWIDSFSGWGSFTAAKVLTDKTASWTAIWNNGELIVSQIRKRLYWEFSYLSPSGVTGITGAQITARDPQIDEIAIKSIHAITEKPNGIVSVDFTYDENGLPNPTEIQASRFFSSTYFMAKAGLNLPYYFVKLALHEDLPPIKNKFSPLNPDLLWIKYVDCLPLLTTVKDIEKLHTYTPLFTD